MKGQPIDNSTGLGDLFLVGMGSESYNKLQAAASKEGVTVTELLARAVDGYLAKAEANKPEAARKLLLEASGS